MGSKSSSLLCLALLLAFSSTIFAFDIAELLGQYPEFSTFNKYIIETKLLEEINSRNTITVLAVDNGGISGLAGKSPEAIKAIISTHVILDYFDEKKLMEAQGSGQQLTTLYQASGNAVNQQGFLKVALIGEGEIAFSSAASGAATGAELVRTVTSEPYNISILQVTKPIVFPGVDSPSGAQAPAQSAKAPVAAQGAKAPSQSAKAPAEVSPVPGVDPTQAAKSPVPAQAPTPSETVTAPSPSDDESIAQSPTDVAGAPEATSPTVAEGPTEGPVADDDEDAADAPPPPPNSASTIKMGLVGAMMACASLLVFL